jgi:hypothetical protein
LITGYCCYSTVHFNLMHLIAFQTLKALFQ